VLWFASFRRELQQKSSMRVVLDSTLAFAALVAVVMRHTLMGSA